MAKAGGVNEKRELNRRLMDLHHQLFVEPNPIPAKWACQRIGLIEDATLRLPMTPLTSAGQDIVEKALLTAGILIKT